MPILTQQHRERALRAAEGYLQLDMAAHALRELSAIDEWPVRDLAFRKLRGMARRALDNHEAAIIDLELALNQAPGDLDVLMALAWCYKRVQRLPAAIAAMQQAYRHHSDEAVVLYNLSCYYALSGEKTQALSWLGRALRMEARFLAMIAEETDFDPLRDDADFQRLLHLVSDTE